MFFTPRRLPTEQIHSRNSCPIYVLLIQTCKAKNPGICLEYSLIFSESNSVIFFPHLPMNRNVAISDFCPRLSCRSSTPDCPPLLQPFLAQIPGAGSTKKEPRNPTKCCTLIRKIYVSQICAAVCECRARVRMPMQLCGIQPPFQGGAVTPPTPPIPALWSYPAPIPSPCDSSCTSVPVSASESGPPTMFCYCAALFKFTCGKCNILHLRILR